MLTRIISGIVLVVILAFAMFLGGNVLFVLSLAVSLMGMYELYKVYNIHKSIIGIMGYVAAAGYYLCLFLKKEELLVIVLSIGLVMVMAGYVATFPKYNSDQASMAFFAVVYVAVLLSYIYRIRIMDNGIYLVWLVFICSWIADTFAYFVGVKFGKHKMTPKLSPKKSVEGAVGGIVSSMLVGGIYGAVINGIVDVNATVVFAIACGVGAVISIFGDLAASAIKRNHDVKDYSKLIPGHGGIMDRFDSVLFTAPAVYMVIMLFA